MGSRNWRPTHGPYKAGKWRKLRPERKTKQKTLSPFGREESLHSETETKLLETNRLKYFEQIEPKRTVSEPPKIFSICRRTDT